LHWTSAPTVNPPRLAGSRRLDVPIPPLYPRHCIPVPPPTLPSRTGPGAAAASAANTSSFFTWKPKMSLRSPSHVSATTGRQQWSASGSRSAPHSISASRTVPTLLVLVMAMG
jgi:hypothetical protein